VYELFRQFKHPPWRGLLEFQHIPWGGVLELSNTPIKGGVGQLEHPPVGGFVPKKIPAPLDLFTCINLHPPNILLHPPIFEILENTLDERGRERLVGCVIVSYFTTTYLHQQFNIFLEFKKLLYIINSLSDS